MAEPTFTVKPLDDSTWDAFANLVARNNGVFGGCWYVGKGHRRQGVASAAFAGALDLIADEGGGTVEGYPEAADAVPAGFLYNGALSTYEKLGFIRDRKIGKHRWVVTRVVHPRL
jgi:GNAT superfamily N-acetyltransferase